VGREGREQVSRGEFLAGGSLAFCEV